VDPDISIRAHYERFPATIKGAFVLRGVGRDPHQVRIEQARVSEASGRGAHPIDIEPVTLEVAPQLDLFVPFEFPVADLPAGWYSLECDVTVDGIPDVVRPGSRFPVAWPRATVRRGTVRAGKGIETSSGNVKVETVECAGDSIKVMFTADSPPVFTLTADGSSLPVLEVEFDEDSRRGRVLAYPLMRTQEALSIACKGATTSVEIRLP
jgi:hypothetical protein